MQRYNLVSKSHRAFNHSISAAKRFISLFHHIGYPTEEQLAMLAAAPKLVPGLSWLALLAGLVVVMKTYWVALIVRSSVRKTD